MQLQYIKPPRQIKKKWREHLMRHQFISAPETFLLVNLSPESLWLYFIPSLPKLSYVKPHVFPCSTSFFHVSLNCLFYFYTTHFVTFGRSGRAQIIMEKETLVLSLCEEKNGRKRMEQQGRGSAGRCPNVCLCLIGPQMSQRPSQISLSRRKEETSMKGRKEIGNSWRGETVSSCGVWKKNR